MNIREQIGEVQKKVDGLKYELAIEEAVLARLKSLGTKRGRKPLGRKAGPPREGSLAAQIAQILTGASQALSVAEIVTALEQREFSTGGKTGLNNLVPSAMTRRPDIFVRVRHGVYDLKSRVKQENQVE